MVRPDDTVDENGLSCERKDKQPCWRALLKHLRENRENRYMRMSRKMINHLVSIGLKDARNLLADIEKELGAAALSADTNVPGKRVSLADCKLMTGEPFELASRYLGDEEIMTRLQKWLREEKASFFSTVVGDPRSTMPEIAGAIRRYLHILQGRSGLPLSTLKSLRVSLIQRFLTEQLDFINVAKEVVRITDFGDLIDRMITTEGGMGKLGGKASGMLLAKWILEEKDVADRGLGRVKTPRTWYIVSDAIMDFIRMNDLQDVMEQKFKDVTEVRRDYPNLVRLFKQSAFPPEVVAGLARALAFFGDRPLIVRSSSLLEDRFGTTFSGKYKSLFLANQGSEEERLAALIDAVSEVWASVLGPDPLEYRRERGLQEFIEEMGILIQEVIGTRVGKWWLPAFAGVAFSNNEFRWSPRIKREDGLIRLVPGLGTRAVDRVGDDFPILAVPARPGLRANVSVDEILRYAPEHADVINLETNTFETVKLTEILAEAGGDYPLLEKMFSVVRNGMLQQVSRFMLDTEKDDLVVDMEGLLGDGRFVPMMQSLLTTLAEYLGHPVDIEFAHDGKDFYLLQCRPQAQSVENSPAPIPRDVAAVDMLFTAQRFVSNGWVPAITHIVYVDPAAYGALPSPQAMKQVAWAVGRLNRMLPRRKFILMGPGRWGSRGDIKLGVTVTYADINNTAMLIEIARRAGDYLPDLSFGTHFFQDLVEARIRYLPLYPDDDNVVFNEDFLGGSSNLLADLLPEFAELADVIKVIDIPAVSGGRILRVLLNADLDEAAAMLAHEDEVGAEPQAMDAGTMLEPRQYWRWRFRLAESLAQAMEPRRFGVEAVYLYGSVKNGTAGPDSQIDLLVHFNGTDRQKMLLEFWFEGWALAASEFNYARTGVRVADILNVTYLNDAEVAAGAGPAARINAVTNPARKLSFGG